MNITYEWVSEDQRVKALVDQWCSQDFVTIDTEFVRTRTFYPQVGLLQVADNQGVYLIDPLALTDLSPLTHLLEDPTTIKVLHSGSEDAEIFHYFFKAHSRAVFDSQIGAGVLGLGMSIGYANLVKAELDFDVPKEETRSDWLKRPLSESQKQYAALDVHFLYQIYQKHAALLRTAGRFSWVIEDSERMISAALPNDTLDYYQKIRVAWQLKGERLWLLQQLASWRELQVAQMDIPRARFIKDAVLANIAQMKPTSVQQLHQVADLSHRTVKQWGDTIVAFSNAANEIPKSDYPQRIMGPLKKEASTLLKSLRVFLEEICLVEDIPVELVARKKYLELLINSGLYTGAYALPEYYCGWRKDLVGTPLLEKLSQLDRIQQG
jgi:ribonuclease D